MSSSLRNVSILCLLLSLRRSHRHDYSSYGSRSGSGSRKLWMVEIPPPYPIFHFIVASLFAAPIFHFLFSVWVWSPPKEYKGRTPMSSPLSPSYALLLTYRGSSRHRLSFWIPKMNVQRDGALICKVTAEIHTWSFEFGLEFCHFISFWLQTLREIYIPLLKHKKNWYLRHTERCDPYLLELFCSDKKTDLLELKCSILPPLSLLNL